MNETQLEYECGNLHAALAIMAALAKGSTDPAVRASYRTFALKLGLYGLPTSPSGFNTRVVLRIGPETLKALTTEATQSLRYMQARIRAHEMRREGDGPEGLAAAI